LARALARALGVPYVNTGAAYRYAAWWAVERRLHPDSRRDRARLVRHLRRAAITLTGDGAVRVGSARFDHRLTGVEVEDAVAAWAALDDVRDALAGPIRKAVRRRGVVVEGRDAGTMLLPDAEHKLYVDAALEVRAGWLAERAGISRRRARASIAARDRRDRARERAPLRRAPDALVVRTDSAPLDELVARLARRVREA
jgi:cytidylate kinase